MAGTGKSGDDKSQARRGGMMTTIAAVAILTLLAGGGGAGLGMMIGKPGANPAAAPAATDEAAAGEAAAPRAEEASDDGAVASEAATRAQAGGPTYAMIDLAPVLTNIYAPQGTWLRVEAKLVVRNDDETDNALLAAQVSADTLAFLRSVQLSQIEGTRGLMHLRDDLRERAMMRSPAVVDYLIQSLVAE